MKLLGITGGIGMGKSTATDLLSAMGLAVIDTDQIARQVVEPGQPALAEIVACFGQDILSPDGRLRRDELARRVFSNPERRRVLEGILHPRIRETWLRTADQWRQQYRPAGVVAIPLLFETEAAGSFDAIICIGCSTATQEARLQARGWSRQQMVERIQSQWPLEHKMALAQFVIWTEGVIEVHARQWQRVLKILEIRPDGLSS